MGVYCYVGCDVSKLTDLEICTAIAKRELADTYQGMEEHSYDGICALISSYGMVFREKYNPLTEDALCFQLMVKYKVLLTPITAINTWSAAIWDEDANISYGKDENPNKAICLAIIEAHK